jgi:hypothetical protein
MDHKNEGVRVARGQANPVGRHELEAVVSEVLTVDSWRQEWSGVNA